MIISSKILIGLFAALVALGSITYMGVIELDRQAKFERAFQGRSIEAGASLYTEFCSECHGLQGYGTPRAPALNTRQFFENRVEEVGYLGGLPAYIRLTVAAGRPIRTKEWPQDMPTWAIEYGGPLRNDQIDNVVNYIMNWEEGAPDADEIVTEAVTGDTPEERGAGVFTVHGCSACHAINGEGGAVGPDLANVYSNGEDYVRESIVDPGAVVVEGYQDGIMPKNFGEIISDDDLNDLIAYFKSLTEG